MIGVALVIVVISLIGLFLKATIKSNQYWKEKGVKHKKPIIFFGNLFPTVTNKKTFPDVINEIYSQFSDEMVVGYYEFMTPRLMIRDQELIQKILIKDFSHFVDHGFQVNEEKNPMDVQLFTMTGNRWRAMRNKLTPLFTSGKLRTMYDCMSEVGKDLLSFMEKRKGTDIDIREAMGLFSMDIIGSAAFGFNPRVLNNPESEFRVMGKKLIDMSIINMIRMWFFFAFPNIAKKLGIALQDSSVVNYYCNIIRNTIEYRKQNDIQRNDFVQMMLQLKEKGKVELKNWEASDDYLISDTTDILTEKFEITDDILMAQAHQFLTAGFEATALLLTYTLLEISQKLEMQETIRKEVLEQVKLNGGLTYDAVRNMKYLEQTIKETQRFYPLIPFLFRICTEDYTLPNGVIIKKGENIMIPVTAVHMDPNIYPEPNEFNPERFNEQPKPGTFLPFGEGPRMCIAMRYATLVMKYGLALFLMNYKAKISPKTKLPVKFNSKAFLHQPSEKILFNIEKIQ